jgi:hypothetical protein
LKMQPKASYQFNYQANRRAVGLSDSCGVKISSFILS